MKKCEAIRRAREAIPTLTTFDVSHFVVRVPADYGRPDAEFIDVPAGSYQEALHTRAYAICRVALVYMDLGHIPLAANEGSTMDQLMNKALARASKGPEQDAAMPFWQIRLG